jgi:threonine/homoserine/homoserine lactone efflux protein
MEWLMQIVFFLRGLVIGFSIAAPVGPISVLCIRRTLTEGRISGLISGLGAATADALYGSIAAFSLTFISNILINQQTWIGLIGGVFLCFLGLKIFLSPPAKQAARVKGHGLVSTFASTFFLTLTNPMTILSFAAIFAGLGVGSQTANYLFAATLVLGVFTGSALWWLILSSGVSLLGQKIESRRLQWVNRISGIIIIIFGLLALLSLRG